MIAMVPPYTIAYFPFQFKALVLVQLGRTSPHRGDESKER